jgi:DNA-binding MarR family transcriptional regulator
MTQTTSSRVRYAADGRSRTLPEEEMLLASMRFHEVAHESVQAFLKEYDITGQQLNVLRILYVRGEPVPTGFIAERLISRVPDVPRLIDRLESRGLVERHTCVEDRRRTLVRLTKAGEKLVTRVDGPLLAHIEGLFAHLSQKKVALLTELLHEARVAASQALAGRSTAER